MKENIGPASPGELSAISLVFSLYRPKYRMDQDPCSGIPSPLHLGPINPSSTSGVVKLLPHAIAVTLHARHRAMKQAFFANLFMKLEAEWLWVQRSTNRLEAAEIGRKSGYAAQRGLAYRLSCLMNRTWQSWHS